MYGNIQEDCLVPITNFFKLVQKTEMPFIKYPIFAFILNAVSNISQKMHFCFGQLKISCKFLNESTDIFKTRSP